jgi:hypothetical protein
MKKLIRKLLRESILSEKLTDVDTDVDMLYDKYFKGDVDAIERTGFVTSAMFEKSETDTSILTSPDSIRCHEVNPCVIKINPGLNYYNPNNKIIGIGVSKNAYNFVIDYVDGSIERAIEYLQDEHQRKTFIKEFTEARIKGSIHHELAHWIDDTLNNSATIKDSLNAGFNCVIRSIGG